MILNHQMFVNETIDPDNQHIILKIVRFIMARVHEHIRCLNTTHFLVASSFYAILAVFASWEFANYHHCCQCKIPGHFYVPTWLYSTPTPGQGILTQIKVGKNKLSLPIFSCKENLKCTNRHFSLSNYSRLLIWSISSFINWSFVNCWAYAKH